MTRNLEVRGACAAIFVALASGAAAGAEQQTADDGWPARWNKVGPVEAGIAGGLVTTLIFLEFLVKPPATPRWEKPILFDSDARGALRAGSPGGRSRAAIASDLGYGGLPLYAIAVEAGLVTWLGRDKRQVALQLALINGEALAINGVLTRVAEKTLGRKRPDAPVGGTDNTAFPSGHTSTAFTIASGLCVQHARLEIYGGVADKLVCPAAVAVATTTGLLRIVSDRHWASDVLAGAVLGTLVGTTVSWAHMHDDGAAPQATFSLGPGGRSLVYGRSF
jgi:membrane-associated phospholipid phosphatase